MVQDTLHEGRSRFSLSSLEDKYTAPTGHFYMTGIQALVRLCINQRLRDIAHGRHTAGFVSGYRGSPLGPLDKEFWKAEAHMKRAHVRFEAAVNEELAATAVMGSQQLHLFPGARYDGVFAMWYGKAPGVDRCADAFKHGNFAGSARHGGVLLMAGDDHGAYSSSLPNQSDQLLCTATSHWCIRRVCRISWIWGSTAGRCHATRAAGSGSRRWPTRWRAPRSWTWTASGCTCASLGFRVATRTG